MLAVGALLRLLLSLLRCVSVLSIARLSQVSHRVGVGRILVGAVNHARFELLDTLHALVEPHVGKYLRLVNVSVKYGILLLGERATISCADPVV